MAACRCAIEFPVHSGSFRLMADRFGFLASASAVVLSIVSLSVAISANRTQERLLAASVWPSLEYGTGNRDDDGADVITLSIGNSGIGPARLGQVLTERKQATSCKLTVHPNGLPTTPRRELERWPNPLQAPQSSDEPHLQAGHRRHHRLRRLRGLAPQGL